MKVSLAIFLISSLPIAMSVPTKQPVNAVSLSRRGDVKYGKLPPVAFSGDSCNKFSYQINDDGDPAADLDDCKTLADKLRNEDKHWDLMSGNAEDWLALVYYGDCYFNVNRKNLPNKTTDSFRMVGTKDVAKILDEVIERYTTTTRIPFEGRTYTGLFPVDGKMECKPYAPLVIAWSVNSKGTAW